MTDRQSPTANPDHETAAPAALRDGLSELAAPDVATVAAASSWTPALGGDGQLTALPRVAPAQQHQSLLTLQRTQGHHATQHLMRRQQSGANTSDWTTTAQRTPSLQRFVGHEHAKLGDTTQTTIDLGNGVVLTWG